MITADQTVAIFDSFVGITESPPHSNRTPIGQEFGWNGVPWCAETCSVVLKRAFGRVILWTASVAQAIADAKAGKNGMRWHDRNTPIRKGWLVTYDFGGRGNYGDFHIAMVRDPSTQTKFQTDGGNEGDAVRQQWRDRTYVQGFIEIPYDTNTDTRPKEDDDMPSVFVETINSGEKKAIAVPPAHSGGAGWGSVWGSLAVDNYSGTEWTDVRVFIKRAGGDAVANWYPLKGANDKGSVALFSGRTISWEFGKGDECVSFENHGKYPITFLCEAAKA